MKAHLRVTLLLALAAASCSAGREGELGVSLASHSTPLAVGATTFTLELTADGLPLQNAVVEVEGNMSHAGMVPVYATATELEDGRYEVDLELTMGGDWFLLVDATLPDGRSLQGVQDVPGVLSARDR